MGRAVWTVGAFYRLRLVKFGKSLESRPARMVNFSGGWMSITGSTNTNKSEVARNQE
jgi:hypothetical protein